MTPNTRGSPRIAAIVVTFNPDVERLRALLTATAPQVDHIYVVDNGAGTAVKPVVAALAAATLLVMGENVGIGAAQNAGANAAVAAGSDFVLLLDQDSVPDQSMVQQLLMIYQLLVERGHRIAAVGPRTPSRGEPGSFVTVDWFHYRKVKPRGTDRWVFCDLLIASGMLIPAPVFSIVGPMDESLFIDKVDTEWSIRAACNGYRLAGAPGAILSHSLGERAVRVWWNGWKHLPAHHPFRYYYIVRNCILMCRRPSVTWRWRTADVRQTIGVILIFGIAASARSSNLRMIMRGLVDGLLGRTGPLMLDNSRRRAPTA